MLAMRYRFKPQYTIHRWFGALAVALLSIYLVDEFLLVPLLEKEGDVSLKTALGTLLPIFVLGLLKVRRLGFAYAVSLLFVFRLATGFYKSQKEWLHTASDYLLDVFATPHASVMLDGVWLEGFLTLAAFGLTVFGGYLMYVIYCEPLLIVHRRYCRRFGSRP